MIDAAAIAQRLLGRRAGDGYLAHCPVPGHGKGKGDRNPSLTIRDGDVPGRLLFTCHAGCDRRDIVAVLRARGILGDDERTVRSSVRRPTEPLREREPDPAQPALALWRAAGPIEATLAETYLTRHRGLRGPFPPTLRFRGDIRYPHAGTVLPAMIAAVQRPDRNIVAVQLTFLRPTDGAKARVYAPRMTRGSLGTGAVRLAPAGETLGIAEGVETGLSAMEMTRIPVWVSLGGQRLGRLTLPPHVRRVVIFGDNDAAGRLMAERAAGAYSRHGRAVELRWPPDGCNDWNDVVRERSRAVA